MVTPNVSLLDGTDAFFVVFKAKRCTFVFVSRLSDVFIAMIGEVDFWHPWPHINFASRYETLCNIACLFLSFWKVAQVFQKKVTSFPNKTFSKRSLCWVFKPQNQNKNWTDPLRLVIINDAILKCESDVVERSAQARLLRKIPAFSSKNWRTSSTWEISFYRHQQLFSRNFCKMILLVV